MSLSKQQIEDALCQTDQPVIVFTEKRSSVRFENPDRDVLEWVNLDGGLIDQEECCDHFLRHNGTCYFIELKGSQIEKAIKQIFSAVQLIKKVACARYVLVISGTRVPSIAGFQKAYLKAKRQFPNLVFESPILRSSGVSISLEKTD